MAQLLYNKVKVNDKLLDWINFNLIFIFLASIIYMNYTNGQVTIEFINNNYNFTTNNITGLNQTINPNYLEINNKANSLFRTFNEMKDKNHYAEIILKIIYLIVIPLYNIIYLFSYLYSKKYNKPKDLNTININNK